MSLLNKIKNLMDIGGKRRREQETMSLSDAVDEIMQNTGLTKEKAEAALMKIIQSGELRIYGKKANNQ